MSEVDLFDEIIERQTLTEREASDVIKQVFQAIAHMHKHNVVHRDIKVLTKHFFHFFLIFPARKFIIKNSWRSYKH